MTTTRTNFYKIPLEELEERVSKLREWWWDNKHDPRRAEVHDVLEIAYHALEGRKAIAKDPEGNKDLKMTIDMFWGDIPKKYETADYEEPTPISPELAKKTGLKKTPNGWLFDLTDSKE